ncbi:Capsule polysaccharide biosynthesis protein [Polaromonas sp. YR568]|uniref:capsular polysaccharide export protein, LipB/KpsS family n=1 Tax=Polaromonas sp. YR568 TaxID=1855301 RepID=UPI0008ED9F7E|nr:hypothetical protein [Polaromonas sp. YR568]SFU91646.1 Capsule polysaccharide biosynthesis protein [Polaromonas sp. YR568]
MKRVFFMECAGPVWRTVAERCMAEAQWQPVLWTAAGGDAKPVAELCPEAIFLTGPDAALGLHVPSWPLPALDARLLADLAPAESIALHMMDRMDPACGSGFPHDARRRHYHHLLRYWMGALNALNPDLIIFSISPHIVFDYILMALARHRGIPTIMFERIGMPGWVFPMRDFEHGSPQLRSALSSQPLLPVERVPEAFRTWLLASIDGQSAVPANFQKKLERYKLASNAEMPSMLRALAHEFKRAAALLRKNGLSPAPNSYLRSLRYPHGRCGPMETLASRLKGVLAKRRLMRFHDALTKADGAEKYALLALHYQPERATVPMGAQFGDQLLIVDLLAKALPAGWKLYVKEHPWQLQSFGRGEVQRTEAFYAEIAAHPNVILLPRGASTAALVRGAQAVATVTGSVGWDALCAGVPVLLFGAAWYRDCPGAHQITSYAGLCEALGQIGAGHKPEREGLAAFCAALSGVCVPGVLEPELERTEHLSHEDAASAMAAALINLDSLEEDMQ